VQQAWQAEQNEAALCIMRELRSSVVHPVAVPALLTCTPLVVSHLLLLTAQSICSVRRNVHAVTTVPSLHLPAS
jgi:hypothetical protein